MTTPLQQAAQALIQQWDSPGFIVDDEIAELRKALDAELQQPAVPVAEVIECQIMGQQTVREIEGRWKFLQYGDKLYLHPPQRTQPSVPVTANNDEVICPSCCHQFRAIPVGVQQLMLDAGFEPPFKHPPQQADDLSLAYAKSLAVSTAKKHYPEATEFELLGDMHGVIGQIDHMLTGMQRKPQQAKPKTAGDVQEMCIAALQRAERAELIAKLKAHDEWVDTLTRGKSLMLEAADMLEADAQQAKQVPMTDWKAEQIDDYEIRVTSPEGESWRLRSADRNDIFNNFIWRWAQSMVWSKA